MKANNTSTNMLGNVFFGAETKPSLNSDSTSVDVNDVLDAYAIKQRPELHPHALTGVVGNAVELLTDDNELIHEFVAIELLWRFASSIPRGHLVMKSGLHTVCPRIYAVTIARTGAGKGKSASAVDIIFDRISKDESEGSADLPLVANLASGNVGTPEGLVWAIRDPGMERGRPFPGVEDKRLVIRESEFASLIKKSRSENSVLSELIRNAWDGSPLGYIHKNSEYGVAEPHIFIDGDITPKEFLNLVSELEVNNGLLNRCVLIAGFAREPEPCPLAPDEELLGDLCNEISAALTWIREAHKAGNSIVQEWSDDGFELWCKVYRDFKSFSQSEGLENTLLTRSAHYVQMLAMLYAALDKSVTVELRHLRAAIAWRSYWHQSIRYVFDTERNAAAEHANKIYDLKVLNTIRELGGLGEAISIRKVYRKLKSSAGQTKDSIKRLQETAPPKVKVTTRSDGPRASTYVQLCDNGDNGDN